LIFKTKFDFETHMVSKKYKMFKQKEKEYRISKKGIRQVRVIGTKKWLKRCSVDECTKTSRSKSDKCIAHGGGKRCIVKYCTKSARGKSDKCIAHGGGKRCIVKYCTKSAQGKSDKCIAHGGGNIYSYVYKSSKSCQNYNWVDTQLDWVSSVL
jgi:hypothetical protein